jgi:hypothetical protein
MSDYDNDAHDEDVEPAESCAACSAGAASCSTLGGRIRSTAAVNESPCATPCSAFDSFQDCIAATLSSCGICLRSPAVSYTSPETQHQVSWQLAGMLLNQQQLAQAAPAYDQDSYYADREPAAFCLTCSLVGMGSRMATVWDVMGPAASAAAALRDAAVPRSVM